MWITDDVNIPQDVLDAFVAGKLVFFVGAGASMDAPSSLPSFDRLARDLARLAGVPFSRSGGLDFFLGSLPADFDTHRHAREMIDRPDSAPNRTHRAIVELAAASGRFRVVTTNFDTHLSAAATEAQIDAGQTWSGPALPLGADHIGIIHLHGAITGRADELVLTDRDFGRAYLTDAWAARFLLPLFDAHTVVFIGYSYDDTIMRYLSLGLPSHTKRFAFDSNPENAKWAHLDITPIAYSTPGNTHHNLVDALEAWTRFARMGRLEHDSRIRTLAAQSPQVLTPVENDYLFAQLQTARGAGSFADAATDPGWLHWAGNLDAFKHLFDGRCDTESSAALARWFAQGFVERPEHNAEALRTVQRLGQRWSLSLVGAVEWAAGAIAETHPTEATRWKALIASSIHGHSASSRIGMGMRLRRGDHPESPVVIRSLLRAHLALTDGYRKADLPDSELKWSAQVSDVEAVLRNAAASDIESTRLLLLLEESLCAAYDLLYAYRGAAGFDELSFRRSGVEDHEQDTRRQHIDAIVDCLRDVGEAHLERIPCLPERWWALGYSLFRRLALHVIDRDPARSADEKLRWLLDRSCLYDPELKHETYRLVASTAAFVSPDQRKALLDQVNEGPELAPDANHREVRTEYATFALLAWITRHAPDWDDARMALGKARANSPSFREDEHPDTRRWVFTGSRPNPIRITPADLIGAAERDADAAIEDIAGVDYPERSFEDVTREDVGQLLSSMASMDVSASIKLWDALDRAPHLARNRDLVAKALVEGWSETDLGEHAADVTTKVRAEVGREELAHAIATFLFGQIRLPESPGPMMATDLRDIAKRLWGANAAKFDCSRDAGWWHLHASSWPGILASYWLADVQLTWHSDKFSWSGLIEPQRSALGSMLEGPRAAVAAARSSIAKSLYFLFAADEEWTTANLLPLFRDEQAADQVWAPFLHDGRVNARILKAGLLKGVTSQWSRIGHLNEGEEVNGFLTLVAETLSIAPMNAPQRRKLLYESVLSSGGAFAEKFASATVRYFRSPGTDAENSWVRWLGAHIRNRLKGLPRNAAPAELSAWADVVPTLGERIPEGLAMFRGVEPGLGQDWDENDWEQCLLGEHSAVLVEHLAERVVHTPGGNAMHEYAVLRLIENLRDNVSAGILEPLVRAARVQGYRVP